MRLEAGKLGGRIFTVFHVPTSTIQKRVVWVDDQTAEWCQHVFPLQIVDDELQYVVRKAQKIEIHDSLQLVLIDPIEDSTVDAISVAALNIQPVPA